jgi:radical SAM protein with 4Fe4S-binding SPASM domain
MIVASTRPKIIENAFYAKKEGKYLILNPDAPDWIVVNESAAYLLSLCDGQRDLSSIAEIIRAEGHELNMDSVLDLCQLAADKLVFQKEFEAYKSSQNAKDIESVYSPKPLRSVHLKLTNECNLSCTYCYAESGLCTSSPILPIEDLKRLAGQVSELSSSVIYTFSGGEPLMHPAALEFAEYLRARDQRCCLLTNGVPVNKKNVSQIAKLFELIKISLDGSSEEINSKTRGRNSYRAVLKAYNLLIENGANVMISMTVNKSNLSDIQSMVDMFGSHLSFQPLFKAGRGKEGCGNEITGDEYYQALAAVEGVKPMSQIEDLLAMLRGRGKEKCPLADGDISISESGNVYPCQMLYEDEFCGGNVKDNSVAEIYYNSGTFESLRKLVVENVEGCSGCPIRRLCGGSCRARSYHETGDISVAGVFCDYERQAYINGILDSTVLN